MKKMKKNISLSFVRGVFATVMFVATAALSGCGALSGVAVSDLTPEQIAEETAKAEETIKMGQTIAESIEFFPFPFNLIAAAGGGALILLGGKKTAKLTGAAAKKIVVPALAATAGKILKKKTDPEACNCAQDTPEKTEAPEGTQNQ